VLPENTKKIGNAHDTSSHIAGFFLFSFSREKAVLSDYIANSTEMRNDIFTTYSGKYKMTRVEKLDELKRRSDNKT